MNERQWPQWLDIAREAMALSDFASRYYVAQPPHFRAASDSVAHALAFDEHAVVYLDAHGETFFGYPGLNTADALLAALRLRREIEARIEVASKASYRYDAMLASLGQHAGDESLSELFHRAVGYGSLEAYVAVYAERPERLLQPAYRARKGYVVFPVPPRDLHERFVAAAWQLVHGDEPLRPDGWQR